MDKILLIGFRGVGKTTLGRALAEKLRWDFLDLDEEIVKKVGRSIAEIVGERGWDYFRALEREAMRDLLGLKRLVCALGGGAVLHGDEMQALKRESIVILLETDLETIKHRLLRDPKTLSLRPALTSDDILEELEKVYREREPLYRAYGDLVIEIAPDEDPDFLVNRILKGLGEKFPAFFQNNIGED